MIYVDCLRIIAAFLVIVNHTNSRIFLDGIPSLTWYVSLSYFFVCKVAVPIFFMIMGATLLGKTDPPVKWGTRMLRILCVGLAFSLLYYLYYRRNDMASVNFVEFLEMVFTAQTSRALWYLYAYLGLLLGLPVFQKMARSFTRTEFQILLLLSLVILGTYPLIGIFTSQWFDVRFPTVMVSPYVGMIFAGYYLERYVQVDRRQFFFALGGFVLFITLQVIGTRYLYLQNPEDYLALDNRTLIPITGSAACLFLMAKYLCSVIRIPSWLNRRIVYLGGLTFGIYLFSDMVIDATLPVYLEMTESIHRFPSVVIWELAIFAAGILLTALLRQIPWVRKWI